MKIKDNIIALNSFIAQAGICSRRAAVDLIKNGRITVNDEVEREPGYKVKSTDVVKYKDEVVKPQQKIYILLNKPKGFVSAPSDENDRKSVMSLIKGVKGRLSAVDPLDRDTTGLIIITNDGDLSQELAKPRNKITKSYYVVLDNLFNVELMEKLKKGIFLEDGKAYVDRINFAKGKGRNHLVVDIHGGKKRVIKRIFSHLGFKVVGLDRVSYGGLVKKGLLVGHWRYLENDEVEALQSPVKNKKTFI